MNKIADDIADDIEKKLKKISQVFMRDERLSKTSKDINSFLLDLEMSDFKPKALHMISYSPKWKNGKDGVVDIIRSCRKSSEQSALKLRGDKKIKTKKSLIELGDGLKIANNISLLIRAVRTQFKISDS
ncbi:MAG: hypothetical protein GY749_09065 [Desulfobacteraceae bacterium]|nr:hypothetical protein [Desulfobacteraceae bacterium]